jgi:hypothetical protein
VPGRFDLWQEFLRRPASPEEAVQRERAKAGMGGIGSPAELADNFRSYEEAGVDQLILLQQCGNYRQEHVCESLELFAAEVLPPFQERDLERGRRKQRELEPYVAAAMERVPALDSPAEVAGVPAYPRLWAMQSGQAEELTPDRRPGMAALWQMQVGGGAGKPKVEAASPAGEP